MDPPKRTTRKVSARPTSLRIALCIPFDFGDFPFLLQCLQSIHTQTRQPDVVVISFSRCNATVKEKLIDLIDSSPPLLASTCLLFAEGRQLAGENRNAAAAVAKEHGADVLSFFDADDIAHPRRLEIIEQAFLRHPDMMAVLHGYTTRVKEPVRNVAALEWPAPRGVLYRHCFRVGRVQGRPARLLTRDSLVARDPAARDLQNGHVSVRLEVWEQTRYNERLPVGEDSYFNAALYERYSGGAIGLLPDTLCYYLNAAPVPPAPRPVTEETSDRPE